MAMSMPMAMRPTKDRRNGKDEGHKPDEEGKGRHGELDTGVEQKETVMKERTSPR